MEAMMLSEGDRSWLEQRFNRTSDGLKNLNDEFNAHKLEDQALSNAIARTSKALTDHLEDHREEKRKKAEAESETKSRKLQWAIARYTAISLFVITLLGILFTGILNHIELRSQREQIKAAKP